MQSKNGFIKSGSFKGIYKGLSIVSIGSIPGGIQILFIFNYFFLFFIIFHYFFKGALFFATYDTSKTYLNSIENIKLPVSIIQMISASIGELVCLIFTFYFINN